MEEEKRKVAETSKREEERRDKSSPMEALLGVEGMAAAVCDSAEATCLAEDQQQAGPKKLTPEISVEQACSLASLRSRGSGPTGRSSDGAALDPSGEKCFQHPGEPSKRDGECEGQLVEQSGWRPRRVEAEHGSVPTSEEPLQGTKSRPNSHEQELEGSQVLLKVSRGSGRGRGCTPNILAKGLTLHISSNTTNRQGGVKGKTEGGGIDAHHTALAQETMVFGSGEAGIWLSLEATSEKGPSSTETSTSSVSHLTATDSLEIEHCNLENSGLPSGIVDIMVQGC
uniref:Uncharacterized protein n=1 Tax=Sphaerodactylus townsendi TaxID=933632 RepID=A0ACB8FDG4_9SAUR